MAEPREHRLLRVIEQFTRSRIEVATVPTVADLRARQLDITRATLRERLVAGNFDNMRVVVDSLGEEFDIVDIATAAVSLAHVATVGEGNEREIPVVDTSARPDWPRDARGASPRGKLRKPEGSSRTAPAPGAARPARKRSGDDGRIVRLFIGAGRQAGVRPGDLVGAITGEAGVESRSLGAIEIGDRFSLVEVPESMADEIIEAMRSASIRGKKVQIRRERY
ncbi:MAG: DbpA RNA binding domain-containing protein [Vicinamibacterales bacterium]